MLSLVDKTEEVARLGDQEQVPVARAWVASGDAWLRLKGAEILLMSGAADARRVLVPLFAAPGEMRAAAFSLAHGAPGGELVPAAIEAANAYLARYQTGPHAAFARQLLAR